MEKKKKNSSGLSSHCYSLNESSLDSSTSYILTSSEPETDATTSLNLLQKRHTLFCNNFIELLEHQQAICQGHHDEQRVQDAITCDHRRASKVASKLITIHTQQIKAFMPLNLSGTKEHKVVAYNNIFLTFRHAFRIYPKTPGILVKFLTEHELKCPGEDWIVT